MIVDSHSLNLVQKMASNIILLHECLPNEEGCSILTAYLATGYFTVTGFAIIVAIHTWSGNLHWGSSAMHMFAPISVLYNKYPPFFWENKSCAAVASVGEV